jgi:hypothetical protein
MRRSAGVSLERRTFRFEDRGGRGLSGQPEASFTNGENLTVDGSWKA